MTERLRAITNGARAEMYFYGNIGSSMFGPGIMSSEVAAALKGFKNVSEIDIFINSNGGSPFEAVAIYNMLVRHPARVTAYVDSIAASAASIIAMAGDTIHMAANSIFMIHEAIGEVIGNAATMRKGADTLDSVTQMIVETYASRRGIDVDRVREWVDAETWFDSSAALEAKMIDTVTAPTRIAAFIPPDKRAIFKHVPETICNAAPEPEPELAPAPEPAPIEFTEFKKRAASIAALAMTAKQIRQHSAPEDGRTAAEKRG